MFKPGALPPDPLISFVSLTPAAVMDIDYGNG